MKQSENTEVFEWESELSSHRSSDSNLQGSLLSTLSSKKTIIVRAILLAVYKSFSIVNDIQVLSKLFLIVFVPYFFQSNESKNRALKLIDNIQDSDDIEYIIVKIINDSVLSPSTVDLLDKEEQKEFEDTEAGKLRYLKFRVWCLPNG